MPTRLPTQLALAQARLREKRLFSRWGLLTQMPMLLSILRVIVPKACAILKPLEVSSGHNLPSYWHTTHLPSKSRAF